MSPIFSGGGGGGGLPGVTVTGTPAAHKALTATSATAATWQLPPGYEWDYKQITAPVNITATSETTPTTIITSNAVTYDGAAVYCEVFALVLTDSAANSDQTNLVLFESTTQIARLSQSKALVAATQALYVIFSKFLFTPSAASHTYILGAYSASTTGTPQVVAGAGGAGASPPAFMRFVKA